MARKKKNTMFNYQKIPEGNHQEGVPSGKL